jgi:arabinosaccharide transport system permease protein
MKTKSAENLYRALTLPFLLCVAAASLAPFVYLLITSFVTDMSQVFKNGIALKLNLAMLDISNYDLLFKNKQGIFFSWFKNSVILTIMFTTISVVLSSMAGYAISLYEFKGKKFFVVLVLSTMMIPIEILMVPLYNEINAFKLLNTYWGVILPFVVSSFTIYFFMQYSRSLSKDYMDAARIDGCGEIRIYANIMAPLMKPAFASMIILQATNTWNDFLWPLIVMSQSSKLTLTIGLQTFLSPYGNNYNLLFSGAVLSVVPVIILFFFCQKLFIEGMISGGIKG